MIKSNCKGLKSRCSHQVLHAEELSEVNKKLQASVDDNKTLEEKQEALQHDLTDAEDELIVMRKTVENLENEKNELERTQDQLKKELEEQGKQWSRK